MYACIANHILSFTQILSALVAATLADMDTGASDAPSSICSPSGGNRLVPDEHNRDRAPRICYLGMATSIISVFTALLLIQIDMIIFCAPGSVSVAKARTHYIAIAIATHTHKAKVAFS